MRIEVYCDGAAINNGAPGSIGYAAVLFCRERKREFSLGQKQDPSSSIAAELLALELGLEKIHASGHRPDELLMFSDCEPVVRAVKGEYRMDGHAELIQKIRGYLRLHARAEVNWVRGHCGHKLQERAHTLANAAARKALGSEYRDLIKDLFPKREAPTKAVTAPTLCQVRLDAIARPSDVYFRSYVKWFNRCVSYPGEALKERAYEVGAKVAELKRLTLTPPEEMEPGTWLELHKQERHWTGQLRAIEEVLRLRRSGSSGGGFSRGTSAPIIATRDPEPASSDPFAAE